MEKLPDVDKENPGGDKEEYVGRELIHRAIGDPP